VSRSDSELLDVAQRLFEGADFAYGDADEKRPVLLLALPRGVKIGADFREVLRQAAGVPHVG
jgi:hypothetical protein